MIVWARCYECNDDIMNKDDAYKCRTSGLGVLYYRCPKCEERCLRAHSLFREADFHHVLHCSGCARCEMGD